jgi:hypothetical protein
MENLILVVLLTWTFVLPLTARGDTENTTINPVATFSVLGYDPEFGLLGGAVQSRISSNGFRCPAGAVAGTKHRRNDQDGVA